MGAGILIAHGLLALVMFVPVFASPVTWTWDMTTGVPFLDALACLRKQSYFPSVAAAAVPSLLAILNLPLLTRLRRPYRERWGALSSVGLGLLAFQGWGQLLLRYGSGRSWGLVVGIQFALLLALFGVWALARSPRPETAY